MAGLMFCTASLCAVFVLCLIPTTSCQKTVSVGDGSSGQTQFSVGDVRRCTSLDKNLRRFDALPGGGWDNLRNENQGMVVLYNYSLCSTTDDGRFVLPDGVNTMPIRSSAVETFAELFTHWSKYTSTLSKSINVDVGLRLERVGISGSFSDEHQRVKTGQFFEKTATTRIQARYVRYKASIQPDTPLHPIFRDRVQKIAALIVLNKTDAARYESQLLVRDFGTHVITSIDVGAALSQVDQINAGYIRESEGSEQNILASAGVSFFGVFDFGVDYKQTSAKSKSQLDEYRKNRKTSNTYSFGGPNYRPVNFSANDWIKGLGNDFVALDSSGDPIYYTIRKAVLPDVPASVVRQVFTHVKDAVDLYYKYNTYPGCMKEDSPNFSFQANYNDGTCLPVNTNYTFGGVYQTCTSQGYTDLCSGRTQKNPQTGTFSCPSGYDSIPLQGGKRLTSEIRYICESCYLVLTCCNDETFYASAKYQAYWCAAKDETVPQNSGFLFGGLYTANVANPLTRSRSCPDQFHPLTLLQDLKVCVSDDFELGYKYSLPFAGFYTCNTGNPLALRKNLKGSTPDDKVGMLASFMMHEGPTAYPRGCPEGYSQHLAVVDTDCEIHYCIKSGAITAQSLPRIQRPPFIEESSLLEDEHSDGIVLNADGTVWMSLDEGKELERAHKYPGNDVCRN